MKIKKMIFIILVSLILLLLSYKISINQVPDVTKTEYSNQEYTNEENYLLFIKDNKKNITLFFDENIAKKYDYKTVDLFQNDKLILKDVTIDKNGSVDNKIEIVLDSYINSFNRVKINLFSGDNHFFYVGQHYLDKIETVLDEEECKLIEANFKIHKNNYEANFIVAGPSEEVFDIIPSRIQQIGFKSTIEKTQKNSKGTTYKYNATIPNTYYEMKKLNNITFDVILTHNKTNDNNKYFLVQLYVPIDYETTTIR